MDTFIIIIAISITITNHHYQTLVLWGLIFLLQDFAIRTHNWDTNLWTLDVLRQWNVINKTMTSGKKEWFKKEDSNKIVMFCYLAGTRDSCSLEPEPCFSTLYTRPKGAAFLLVLVSWTVHRTLINQRWRDKSRRMPKWTFSSHHREGVNLLNSRHCLE